MYCDVMSKHIHMKIWDATLFHTNVDQMRTAWWLSTAGKPLVAKLPSIVLMKGDEVAFGIAADHPTLLTNN